MKKQLYLITILIFVLIIIVFAIQNAHQVELKLWFWNVNISLSIVIIIALLIGASVSLVFGLPLKLNKDNMSESYEENIDILKKRIKSLEKLEARSRKKHFKAKLENSSRKQETDDDSILEEQA